MPWIGRLEAIVIARALAILPEVRILTKMTCFA
jgi:hypothetical protein